MITLWIKMCQLVCILRLSTFGVGRANLPTKLNKSCTVMRMKCLGREELLLQSDSLIYLVHPCNSINVIIHKAMFVFDSIQTLHF